MRFLTIDERRSGSDRFIRQTGGRGHYFAFEYEVGLAIAAEEVHVVFGASLALTCDRYYWPGITTGVKDGCASLRAASIRLCCIELLVPSARLHAVGSASRSAQIAMALFVHDQLATWAQPVEPLRADWLTSDVVALAHGIHANAALDGLPALYDALIEAGCDDPLVMEHLQTCPDHAPSCWVVEMILDQAAARG